MPAPQRGSLRGKRDKRNELLLTRRFRLSFLFFSFLRGARMRYEYTTAYRIRGIEHKGLVDVELLSDSSGLIRAVLTNTPEKFAGCADDIAAACQALANRLEQQEQNPTLAKLCRDWVAARRTKFEEKFEAVPHVVIQINGESNDLAGTMILENDGCAIYWNANDLSESIRSKDEDVLAAVLASLLLEAGGTLSFDKVWDSIATFRDDGKQIVPFNCAIVAEITETDSLAAGAPVKITDHYRRLSRPKERLSTVLKLLKLSVETENDKFRSFLFGWNAIEIFVNTVFKKYEEEMFRDLSNSSQSELRAAYLTRIRGVMRDKNRLADKFNVVALQLCVTDADDDAEAFRKVKLARDELFHGAKVDEKQLPVTAAHALLIKYLQLHLGGKPRPPTARTHRVSGYQNPFRTHNSVSGS